MNLTNFASQKIIKILIYISILYISADIPKLYFLILFTFFFFIIFEKSKFKNLDIYLVPVFVILFYMENLFWDKSFEFKNLFFYLFWGIIVFLISFLTHNSLINGYLDIRKIIKLFLIGSLFSLIFIFFTNFYFFDFPITRNGFIHPFTRINGEYLIFNLDLLNKVRAVNIRSVYEIIELIFTLLLLLIATSKKQFNYLIIFNIIIFILGCSFGSRLFVIYCLSVNILLILIQKKKKVYTLLLFVNTILFFNNITLYTFINSELYVNLFKDKNTVFKKTKSYSNIYDKNNFDYLESLINNNNISIVYLENNYIVLNTLDYSSFLLKFNDKNYKFLKNKNIEIKNNYYTNTFTKNIDTFSTSNFRFFDEQEKKSLKNRPTIIFEGFRNSISTFQSDYNIYDEKDIFIKIFPTKQIIYHNLLLDSFHNKIYLGSLLLLFIYFRIFKMSLPLFLNDKKNFSIILMLYFIYDQFFQTSILTGKKSIFLFSIVYLIIFYQHNQILEKKNSN